MFEANYKGNKQKNGRSGAVSKKFASAAFLAAAALTAVFISVAYILNERGITVYVCPFYAATGFKCAACGVTRAVFAALSGDFAAAFGYNILWPLVCLIAAAAPVCCFIAIFFGKSFKYVDKALYLLAAFVVLWTIARNLLGI